MSRRELCCCATPLESSLLHASGSGERRARLVEHARELRVERRGCRDVAGLCGVRRERARCDVEHRGPVEAVVQEAQERLRGREPVREILELGERQVQEAVAREELALALQQDRVIEIGLAAQLGEHLCRERVGAGGRARVDHDQEIPVTCGKRLPVLVEVLPPSEIGRHHGRRVGVHAEVVSRIPDRRNGAREQHHDRELAPAQDRADHARETVADVLCERARARLRRCAARGGRAGDEPGAGDDRREPRERTARHPISLREASRVRATARDEAQPRARR